MKKLILALGFILVATLSSQAQNNYQKDIVGKWELDIEGFVKANNKVIPENEKDLRIAQTKRMSKQFSMEFSTDGNATMTSLNGEKTKSTYSIEGNTINFNGKRTQIIKLDNEHFVFLAIGRKMGKKNRKRKKTDEYMVLKKVH